MTVMTMNGSNHRGGSNALISSTADGVSAAAATTPRRSRGVCPLGCWWPLVVTGGPSNATIEGTRAAAPSAT